jgi:tetratricopeptide (TPR) repeat protein
MFHHYKIIDLTDYRERMYKSRLHQWGLDKKKKEHEMLDVIRVGYKRKDIDRDSVFQIRGRPVTLGDALHYFSRKGIKDPTSLLDASPDPSSSPSDAESQSPTDLPALRPVKTESDRSIEGVEGSLSRSVCKDDPFAGSVSRTGSSTEFAQRQLLGLLAFLRRTGQYANVPLKSLAIDSGIPQELSTPIEYRYMEAVLTQTRYHFSNIFATRKLSVNSSTWSTTSDDAMADQFYFEMYHGYSSLWNGENDVAFEKFDHAFSLIQDLLKDQHVGFLIYIYDFVIRYEASGQQVLLVRLLQYLAEMARTIFSENHPVRLIAMWMLEANNVRSVLAEFILRRTLDFFQDSIGYFHQETMALLQTFAWALMNRERYTESAVRFKQLSEAFETTAGKTSYEACFALRAMSEAYFHQGAYSQSLETVEEVLQRCASLPQDQEREMYLRCLRQIAEIAKRLGKDDEAEALMQKCVECCREHFGDDHPFMTRALMHLKSLREDGWTKKPAIPTVVHRLGKGGNAAKYIWASKSALASAA